MITRLEEITKLTETPGFDFFEASGFFTVLLENLGEASQHRANARA